jgi:hypothetical protein
VLGTIIKHPVTIISLVPTMLKRILDLEGGFCSVADHPQNTSLISPFGRNSILSKCTVCLKPAPVR